MQTSNHIQHAASRISHNDCSQCRADNERSFVRVRPFHYDHVTEYLSYVQPRLVALKTDNRVEARRWYQEFMTALNRRISSHLIRKGRKYCDSYLERLEATRFKGNKANASYLRQFANRGASTLN